MIVKNEGLVDLGYFWLTDEVRYDNMQGDQDKGLKEREDPGGQ